MACTWATSPITPASRSAYLLLRKVISSLLSRLWNWRLTVEGFQIVNLTYESFERLPYLLVRKVTSDAHVTSGLVTLRAKMENIKVIDWDWEDPPSITQVHDKDHVTYIELEDLKNRPPQAFLLPRGCGSRGAVPGSCRTVFRGEMLVNDGELAWKWEWAEGFVVVFGEETFGFLNLRSNYLHMFGKLRLNN